MSLIIDSNILNLDDYNILRNDDIITLHIYYFNELNFILPYLPTNIKILYIYNCNTYNTQNTKYIIDDLSIYIHKLYNLKSIYLYNCDITIILKIQHNIISTFVYKGIENKEVIKAIIGLFIKNQILLKYTDIKYIKNGKYKDFNINKYFNLSTININNTKILVSNISSKLINYKPESIEYLKLSNKDIIDLRFFNDFMRQLINIKIIDFSELPNSFLIYIKNYNNLQYLKITYNLENDDILSQILIKNTNIQYLEINCDFKYIKNLEDFISNINIPEDRKLNIKINFFNKNKIHYLNQTNEFIKNKIFYKLFNIFYFYNLIKDFDRKCLDVLYSLKKNNLFTIKLKLFNKEHYGFYLENITNNVYTITRSYNCITDIKQFDILDILSTLIPYINYIKSFIKLTNLVYNKYFYIKYDYVDNETIIFDITLDNIILDFNTLLYNKLKYYFDQYDKIEQTEDNINILQKDFNNNIKIDINIYKHKFNIELENIINNLNDYLNNTIYRKKMIIFNNSNDIMNNILDT